MANKFTPKAQYALNVALSSASDLGHSYIGSEHLLLGLLCEKNTVAYRALGNCGVTYEKSRDMLLKSSGYLSSQYGSKPTLCFTQKL